jgi:hypothetical protein
MKSKPFLIALAAFAVTATGAHAFDGTRLLEKAGLNEAQISAFETAHELRAAGDFEKARDVLTEAGVTEDVLKALREAARENREAIRLAIEAKDYSAFKEVVADSPFAQTIDSEEKFMRLVEAHTLRSEGKFDEARALMTDLGVESPKHGLMWGGHGKAGRWHHHDELTDEQREALQVARKANDKEAVRAILQEAGIDRRGHAHSR